MPIIRPIKFYYDLNNKNIILFENKHKAGVYMWTNLISGKRYVGSSINLYDRFRKYFSLNFLQKEVKKNNSIIYNSILKYGYSSFKLDILEYCNKDNIISREQYYIDEINSEYNILNIVGSRLGVKHTEYSKQLMRKNHGGKGKSILPEITIKKIVARSKGEFIVVINNITLENLSFVSMRRAAYFIGIHPSYFSKCIKINKFYLGKEFFCYISSSNIKEIYDSEVYKKFKKKIRGDDGIW